MSPFTLVPAYNLPVYASQWPLPDTAQDSVRGCSLGFTAAAISGDKVQRTCTAQLPRELRGRRAVAGAVANIEEALQCAEGDFAVRRAFECQMRSLDKIKEVFVPNVHLDDTPATGKSLGEGGKLCHQPISAMSFGNRTRL